MRRRDFLKAAVAAAAGGLSASIASVSAASAQATAWPNKPVKLILPYAPGGATDLIGRPWADKLSQAFGHPFIIENRGGAGGMIGTEAVSKAPADGYTFLLTPSAPLNILPTLRQVPYDPLTSFTPVARVGDLISGFVIHPSVGVKTFAEMLDYAKKNPGKLTFGSAGLGTSTHMRVEMLNYRAKVEILHVPYRGSADALNDLLAGSIHMMNEINPLPHVRAGKLTLLNLNASKRSSEWPGIPTLTELGYPNSDVPSWYSIQAPAGTPTDIIQAFNTKVIEIGKTADMQATMTKLSVDLPFQTPAQMVEFLKNDIKANQEVIKAANIKLE
ncbi:tripartite tricarboxylate transporter substrate binding protein [Bradyrhizobium sp. LHD-71]|uniref:Bug family tripartite tricarboxylate transporter substrate binding protein n=1 Tax=Bradyrhizobium sp. LHD-71 TaxID=3072141 RepID=UPI00280ED2BB|nr:tripartite tricarboxylate transporter substrate binding protein [Bradyrhizobium sp. LHD-71]MDQ8732769.1 tripartite tricarboxylate transporter substrate binding protein [Bradyrhizobium sp. LHD-71]